MATITEYYESGKYHITGTGSGTTYEEQYHIFDATSDEQAFAILNQQLVNRTRLFVQGVVVDLAEKRLEPIDGMGFYLATCVWQTPDSQSNSGDYPRNEGEFAVTLEITTEQFDQKWSEKKDVTPFGGGPDMNGAIEFDGEEVKGVQIEVPVMSFEEEHIFLASRITTAKVNDWGNRVGTVSSARFRGFDAGEVFLKGISTRRKGSDLASANFAFAVSPNQKGLDFGDLKGVNKDGWDYLWISFARDGADPILKPKPLYAYVHKLYRRTDMNDLF